jgi:hypothetical protein
MRSSRWSCWSGFGGRGWSAGRSCRKTSPYRIVTFPRARSAKQTPDAARPRHHHQERGLITVKRGPKEVGAPIAGIQLAQARMPGRPRIKTSAWYLGRGSNASRLGYATPQPAVGRGGRLNPGALCPEASLVPGVCDNHIGDAPCVPAGETSAVRTPAPTAGLVLRCRAFVGRVAMSPRYRRDGQVPRSSRDQACFRAQGTRVESATSTHGRLRGSIAKP